VAVAASPGPGNDVTAAQQIINPFQNGFYLKSVIFQYGYTSNAGGDDNVNGYMNKEKLYLRIFGAAGNALISNVFQDVNAFDQNGYELQIWDPGQYFFKNLFFSSVADFRVRIISNIAIALTLIYSLYAEIEEIPDIPADTKQNNFAIPGL